MVVDRAEGDGGRLDWWEVCLMTEVVSIPSLQLLLCTMGLVVNKPRPAAACGRLQRMGVRMDGDLQCKVAILMVMKTVV